VCVKPVALHINWYIRSSSQFKKVGDPWAIGLHLFLNTLRADLRMYHT